MKKIVTKIFLSIMAACMMIANISPAFVKAAELENPTECSDEHEEIDFQVGDIIEVFDNEYGKVTVINEDGTFSVEIVEKSSGVRKAPRNCQHYNWSQIRERKYIGTKKPKTYKNSVCYYKVYEAVYRCDACHMTRKMESLDSVKHKYNKYNKCSKCGSKKK